MELDHIQDLEAEEKLLSALLAKDGLIKDVYSRIKPIHFYSKKHQTIFQSMENVLKSDQEFDLISVSDELKRMEKLEYIGGRTYINDLALDCITSAPYQGWINIIKEKFVIRELQKIGQNIVDNCHKMEKSSSILNGLQSAIYNLSNENSDPKEGKTLDEILCDRYDQIGYAYSEYQRTNKLEIKNVIKTGWKKFDGYMRGGFRNGELTYIAALSRVGKTAFSIALEREISRHTDNLELNLAIADFQLETPEEELADRHFSNSTGIKKGYFTYVNNLTGELFNTLANSLGIINNQTPIKIFTNPDFNVLEIETKAAQYFNSLNRKGMIFIDNLQIIDDIRKGKNEIEISTNITRDCKKLAKRLNVPVILLAQLVKQAEGEIRPSLKHIRGSQQVIANADNIILLHRNTEKESQENDDFEIIFEKVRKGQTGKIVMGADLSTNKFTERETK